MVPSNRQHVRDQKRVLGPGPWRELNSWMDLPARRLGPKHRRLRHIDTDPQSMLVATLLFGEKAPQAMLIHTVRDRFQTEWDQILNRLLRDLLKPK